MSFLAMTIKILNKYGIASYVERVNQNSTEIFLLKTCLKCGECLLKNQAKFLTLHSLMSTEQTALSCICNILTAKPT
jgi:hypothetical protein